jgi:HEAT repeat protein
MRVFITSCLLNALVVVTTSSAQPTIPQDDIPADIAPDVLHEIRALYALKPETRGMAAYTLRKLGSRAAPAIPFLVAMLGDALVGEPVKMRAEWLSDTRIASEKEITRMERLEITSPGKLAAETLGTIGRPGLGLLHAALKDSDPKVREHAALALGGLKDKTSTTALLPLLTDEKQEVRKRVAHALGRIGDPAALEGLARALKSDDGLHVRVQAAWALGQLRDPRCIEPLMNALGDTYLVSAEAERALAEFRGPHVVDLAIKTLKQEQKNMRARTIAAQILRANADRRAVPALIGALGDKIQVRSEALRALEAISGKPQGSIGPVAAEWQHWWDLEEAGREIESLLTQRDTEGIARAVRTHKNWAVRVRAARALSQFQGDLVLDTLVAAMGDENLDVRIAAVWAVGALRDPKGVEALFEILNSTVKELREEAHNSLQKITGESVRKKDRHRWVMWWHANKKRVYEEAAKRAEMGHPVGDAPAPPDGRTEASLAGLDPSAEPKSQGDGRGADIALMAVGGLIAVSFIALVVVKAVRKPKHRRRRKQRKR